MTRTSTFDPQMLFETYSLVRLVCGSYNPWRKSRVPIGDDPEDESTEDGSPQRTAKRRRKEMVMVVDEKWFKKILSIDEEARRFLSDISTTDPDLFGKGSYLVPNEKLKTAMGELERLAELRLDRIEDLQEAWDKPDGPVAESLKELHPADFKMVPARNTLARRFRFRYLRYVSAPPPDASEAESSTFWQGISDMAFNGQEGLKRELLQLLRHAEEILINPKRKLFASVVDNIVSWAERYHNKSLLSDKAMEKVARDVGDYFRGINIEEIRKDDEMRVDVGIQAKTFAEVLEPMVEDADDIVLSQEA